MASLCLLISVERGRYLVSSGSLVLLAALPTLRAECMIHQNEHKYALSAAHSHHPSTQMKWGPLESNPGQFNFGPAPSGYNAKNIKPCSTQIFEYAKKNDKLLRIHTMFAKSQNPGWIEQLKKEDLQKAMTNILEQVIRRYAGLAIGMD
ncbi:uncharacterized protein VP01_3950g1, partial [Puccinia sorghi]